MSPGYIGCGKSGVCSDNVWKLYSMVPKNIDPKDLTAYRVCLWVIKPHDVITWKHKMSSSNGNIFRVTGHFYGEFTGHRWIPAQRPVTRGFDILFDLRLT